MIFGEGLKRQLKSVYQSGLEQKDPYWNFGWPLITKYLGDLERGLFFLTSCENVGKSAFLVNLGLNVLKYTENSYWLDLALDDNAKNRIGYLLACAGDMPISLVKRAGAASNEEKEMRKTAFQKFLTTYEDRYSLQSEDGELELPYNIFDVNVVSELIGEVRNEIGKDAKLFVSVDGFHDLKVCGNTLNRSENEEQKNKSQILKKAANKHSALITLTAHTRKDSRRRNLSADVLKGDDTVIYDAMAVAHLFSDVGYKREGADVWWNDEGKPGVKMPVLECDILKNKAADFKGVIFYPFLPARCSVYEAPEDIQDAYKAAMFHSNVKEEKEFSKK